MKQNTLVIVSIIAVLVLSLRIFIFITAKPALKNGQRIIFTTRLQQEPYVLGNTQRLSIKTDRAETVFITTGESQLYTFGQKLMISGIVLQKTTAGHSLWMMSYPKINVVPETTSFITAFAASVRQRSRELFENELPHPSGQLLMGIVFGTKEHFSKSFQHDLQTAGVLHVIAASGMNVSFVTQMLLVFFGLFLRRQVALLIAIMGVIGYTVLVGFEAAIVRAAIMSILACGAAFLGRQQWGVFALIVTGYMMLLVIPGFLFDKGFQLSFFATLGILVIKPLLFPRKNLLTEDVGTTISAQVATLPILLGTFGNYGLLSIVVNALVLWTMPVLLLLGSLAVLLSFVIHPLAQLVVWLTWPFLWYFANVVQIAGALPFVLTVTDVPFTIWIGYYLMSLAAVLGMKRKQQAAAVAITND